MRANKRPWPGRRIPDRMYLAEIFFLNSRNSKQSEDLYFMPNAI